MREAYAEGIGWGDAKQKLFERIDAEVAPMRERYESLMARPAEIEATLRDNARRLRAQHATPRLHDLRDAVGLRDLSVAAVDAKADGRARAGLPAFKQYRETDGKFYFKLMQGDRELLVSLGFDSPREAGQQIAVMKTGEAGSAYILSPGVGAEDVAAALAAFRDDAQD